METITYPCGNGRIGIIDFSEPINGSDTRISRVNVPDQFRRKGIGTMMMKEACRLLDENNMSCELEPRPYDEQEISTENLVQFYAKFGFKLYAVNDCIIMIRQPR